MIDIHLEKQSVVVGEKLSGLVVWQSDSTKIPKKVKISIGWHTEGRGNRDRQTVREMFLDPNQFKASQGDDIPFSLSIPYDGPVSYDGKLLRVIWTLKVWVDLPGIFTRDDKQAWVFQVIPRQQ